MNFVLNFLMEQLVGILGVFFGFFVDVATDIFQLNGDQTLKLFFATFPKTEDVMDWSKWCGLLLILIIFFVQLIKIMAGPVTKAERPLSLVVRTVVFGAALSLSKLLCEFIFTVATGPFKAMLSVTKYDAESEFVDAIKDAGKDAGEDIKKGAGSGVGEFVLGAIGPIVTIFLIISLFGAFFKLLLEVVERYLILGVLTIFSPLAIATGCSAATSNIFGSWVRAMISQCLLMIFSVFFLTVLCNGMQQIAVDSQANALTSNVIEMIGSSINSSAMLCVRVMMLVAWCRLGNAMDRHLQTLGITTLQAGDGLAMDLRNGASMAKGLAKGVGSFAGGLAGGLAAMKAAGGGGNNNTTNNNSSQTTPGGGQNGNKAPGVGSSNLPGGPVGKGTSAGSLSNNCQPISNALKDAGISAGNGTTDENGVTTFPLTGPNGEDLGDISLSKDVPENAENGNFVAVDDGAGNTLYAQASNEGVQDVLNNSDDDNISVGVVNENGVNNNPVDDSDKETKDALDGAETFDMVPMDEDGNPVDADVPDSIPEDQVSFDEDGIPYFDADGQNVPLINNEDGTYTPANYGVARNQDGSGEYAMSTGGELVQIPNLNNIPASQVKTDANGNSYCSVNGQNIPVQKNSNGTYSMATSIPASQIKTGANGSSLCNVGGQDVAVKNNGNGTYSLAAPIPASQVKTDANGISYCSVGGQNIPVTKNSDGSYSPATSISSSQVKTDTSGNSFCSIGGQDIPVTKNSDGSYTPETSIPASQVKTDSNGANFCNVGGQDISVNKNNDGTYSPSASSVLGTSTDNLIKSVDKAQPGDSIFCKDAKGNDCVLTLTPDNFTNVSAMGADGHEHDCTGLISSDGTPKSSSVVATSFNDANNFKLNKDSGEVSFSDSSGKQYTVPAAQVTVGADGKVGIKTDGASSFVAKDSSGVSKSFTVSNSAMVSNDRHFCSLDNGYRPSGLRYGGLQSQNAAKAENIKTFGSDRSHSETYGVAKNQSISINIPNAINVPNASSNKSQSTNIRSGSKSTKILGTLSGKDAAKLRKNNFKRNSRK